MDGFTYVDDPCPQMTKISGPTDISVGGQIGREAPIPLRRIAPGQATGLPASLPEGTAEARGSRAARRAVAPATRSVLEARGAVPQACAARESGLETTVTGENHHTTPQS